MDWERHKEQCTFNEKSITIVSILTEEIENLLSKQRIEILSCYKNRSNGFKIGIDLNLQLIETTLNFLREKYEIVKNFNVANFKKKIEIANFIEMNKFIFEHLSNLLLLIYGFILSKYKHFFIKL